MADNSKARVREEMNSRESNLECKGMESMKQREHIREKPYTEAEVKNRMALHAEGKIDKEEAKYGLYIIPADPVCEHLVKYLKIKDLLDMFEVTNVETISSSDRPSWLQGVPSITAPCEREDNLRLLVGEEALEFVRQLGEHGIGTWKNNDCEVGDDLEMLDAHEPAGVTTNSEGMGGVHNRPDDDENLLHYLLPLPVGAGGAGDSRSDKRVDEDAVQKMMALRSAMFD
jgi:hypothetical protein